MIAAAGPIANFALAALGVLGSATIKMPHFNSIALGVSFFNINYLISYLVSDLCLDMIPNADFSEFAAKIGISPIIVFGGSSIALSSLSFLLYKEFYETVTPYQEVSISQLFANDMA